MWPSACASIGRRAAWLRRRRAPLGDRSCRGAAGAPAPRSACARGRAARRRRGRGSGAGRARA
eukprot:scaffold70304_cov44-Phaeocystis_antarctica.AAC.2